MDYNTPHTPTAENVIEVEVVTRPSEDFGKRERDNAEELLRKLAEAGFGLIQIVKSRVERVLNEIGTRNSLNFSREEGKEMVNNFLDEAERARENFETKAREVSGKIAERLDLAHRREVRELKERIEKLEALLTNKNNG